MKEKQKSCAIFVGGAPISTEGFEKAFFDGTDLIIAADSGCAQLKLLNSCGIRISPDIILGDMDSFDKEAAVGLYPRARFLNFPPEKDYTDTQLAAETAIAKGCESITVIGGTGNRADHYLANLALLRKYANENIHMRIYDGKNMVFFGKCGRFVLKNDKKFKYFSLIPDGTSLRGVTIRGAKYNLENADIDRDLPITVSNEMALCECEIEVREGNFFVVLCSD